MAILRRALMGSMHQTTESKLSALMIAGATCGLPPSAVAPVVHFLTHGPLTVAARFARPGLGHGRSARRARRVSAQHSTGDGAPGPHP